MNRPSPIRIVRSNGVVYKRQQPPPRPPRSELVERMAEDVEELLQLRPDQADGLANMAQTLLRAARNRARAL